MEERWEPQRLVALRRLTRQVTELVRPELGEVLTTLKPLFRPRAVLGDHVASSARQAVKGADKAFQQLRDLYDRIATSSPYRLEAGLESPVDLAEPDLEIGPVQYRHVAKADRDTRTVVITRPLQWTLSFAGHSPQRLRTLLAQPEPPAAEIKSLVLHTLALHLVVTQQSGLANLLAALHFPLRKATMPDLGELPVTVVALSVETQLPPDVIILESTEISGTDAFEEVVVPDSQTLLQNDLRGRLERLLRSQ